MTEAPKKSLGFRVQAGWGALPDGWSFVEVAGVATDSRDRVFVFNRGEHPVIIFDREGKYLGSWGEKRFVRPHGITMGPDDSLYLVDDTDHTVGKYTLDGRLIQKMGTSGKPSPTGAQGIDYRTIRSVGPPFNYPTNLALTAQGEMYVADGYGNARVHKFDSEGRLLFSFGEPGGGPGQFRVPHGVAVDREGTLFVADRENSRLQLFSPEGKFLAQWTDVARPCEVFIDPAGDIFVAELGLRAGQFPGEPPAPPGSPGGRVSVFDPNGRLLARWGGGDNPCAPGDFFAPHDIWLDARGDVYVGEVVMSAGGYKGVVPASCHSLQKFVRSSGPRSP